MLWLLEHVRLWVDPLKDAAGSPFGKADRLYLYLHVQKLCVEWGSTNTAGTSMFIMSHIHKVYNGIWEWGIYGLNGWGIYGVNGWGIYGLNWWGHL